MSEIERTTEQILSDPAAQALIKAREAMFEAGRALGQSMLPVFERAIAGLGQLHSQLKAEYERQGSPYGDTLQGFNQWLSEQLRAARDERLPPDTSL